MPTDGLVVRPDSRQSAVKIFCLLLNISMGCVLNKQEDLAEFGLDPSSQRRYLLRFATQSSKYVKYTGCPELTQDDKLRIQSSAKRYFTYLDDNGDVNHFTDLSYKYPRLLNTYFKTNTPDGVSLNTISEDDLQINKADLSHHVEVSKMIIKNCAQKLAEGVTEDLEESLRRIGAVHAECWVCSKDILLIEDSIMWSLDKSDPAMEVKLRNIWRKVIRFILYNIVIGINSHYEKLCYVLGWEKTRFFFFDSKLPMGVDPKSYNSLKRLNSYIKTQQ